MLAEPYFSATIGHAEIYLLCAYMRYTDILFRYVEPEANTHTCHSTHKGKMILPMGAEGAAPIGTIERPPLCVVARVCKPQALRTWIVCLCIAHTRTTYGFWMDNFGREIWFLMTFRLKYMLSGTIRNKTTESHNKTQHHFIIIFLTTGLQNKWF